MSHPNISYTDIIDRYYRNEHPKLKEILLRHSESVTRKALDIVRRHPELNADAEFVEQAAMLHDIGVVYTDAPGIYCFGNEPYIRHGILGAALLRENGLPEHALVCERHTGAGISLAETESQKLPLPPRNYLPVSIEEQIICYADKFFSKTRLEQEKTVEQAIKSLKRFGEEGVGRFKAWAALFE